MHLLRMNTKIFDNVAKLLTYCTGCNLLHKVVLLKTLPNTISPVFATVFGKVFNCTYNSEFKKPLCI